MSKSQLDNGNFVFYLNLMQEYLNITGMFNRKG